MEKVISLKDLSIRIEALEAEVEELRKAGVKAKAVVKTKAAPATADPKKVPGLLKELEAAKKAGDTKKAFTIRKSLRKNGYSLRDANGKK